MSAPRIEPPAGTVDPASGAMDFEAVRALLPQAYPLLLVDRVERCAPGVELRAFKNVSGNDIHFLGHFPGRAVMPGALILEALAQSCVLLFQCTYGALVADELAVFGSVDARFLRPVFPGDRLDLVVRADKMTSTAGVFKVTALVDGESVVRGTLSLGKRSAAELGAPDPGTTDAAPPPAGVSG